MGLRKRLSKEDAIYLGLDPKPNNSDGTNPKYPITKQQLEILKKTKQANKIKEIKVVSETIPNDYNQDKPFILSAWGADGKMMDIDKYCEHYNLPKENITSYKLVSHTGTPFYNIVFKEQITNFETEIDFDAIISKYVKPIKLTPLYNVSGDYIFDKTVYTDVHTAMTTNDNGNSLYGGKWDEDEIMYRKDILVSHTLEHQESDILIVDDLGDLMDGWDGLTTRGGHKLPQNMDNEKAFDVALRFKVSKADALAPRYKKVIFNNICNDNHGGAFTYIVNSAFKSIVESRYNNVSVTNHRLFINHYIIGNRCFIITHGKDCKHLKFGFKPILDSKQIEIIENYIKHHNLYKYDIEFSKGDSHQFIFDNSTSDSFTYNSYPAFSPSSDYIQTNYKKGSSGFVTFNYKEKGEPSYHPFKFEWENNRKKCLLIGLLWFRKPYILVYYFICLLILAVIIGLVHLSKIVNYFLRTMLQVY